MLYCHESNASVTPQDVKIIYFEQDEQTENLVENQKLTNSVIFISKIINQ
jgi:hypothetical protein